MYPVLCYPVKLDSYAGSMIPKHWTSDIVDQKVVAWNPNFLKPDREYGYISVGPMKFREVGVDIQSSHT